MAQQQLPVVASAQRLLVGNLHTHVPAATEDEMVAIAIALVECPEQWCAGLLDMDPGTRRNILMKLGRQQAGGAMGTCISQAPPKQPS
jgi:hypothetical protein